MLHHYNYSSPLSHFLYGPQHQAVVASDRDSAECSPGQTTPTSVCAEDLGHGHKSVAGAANKSFTIAAILGLKQDAAGSDVGREDLTTAVVNLSVHQGISERGAGGGGSGLVSDCTRLQLPVMRGHSTSGPYPPQSTHHQPPHHQQRTVRGLKHVPGSGGGGNPNSATSKKSSSSKSKRVRTIFTPEQLERLEAEFERQQYMVGPERLYLAHTLQLTEAQVKVWFQNRRIKWRKHHLEITHQRLAAIKQQQLQQQLLTDHNTDTLDSNNSDDNTTDTT